MQVNHWENIHNAHIWQRTQTQDMLRINKKMTSGFKNWAKDWNRHFTKEDIQRANEHRKRCLTQVFNRDMQIKSTMGDLSVASARVANTETWHKKCDIPKNKYVTHTHRICVGKNHDTPLKDISMETERDGNVARQMQCCEDANCPSVNLWILSKVLKNFLWMVCFEKYVLFFFFNN